MDKKKARLLLEFLGYVKTSEDKDFCFYEHPTKEGIRIESDHEVGRFKVHNLVEANMGTLFHRNWAWIMAVVEKIEAIPCKDDPDGWRYRVNISHHSCTIDDEQKGWTDFVEVWGAESKIAAVVEACVFLVELELEDKAKEVRSEAFDGMLNKFNKSE